MSVKLFLQRVVFALLRGIRHLAFIFRIHGKSVIVIDGGLGSQILGWIKYQSALELFKKGKKRGPINLDLEYFFNPHPAIQNGLDYAKWELDKYGLNLNDLKRTRRHPLFQFSYNQQAKNEIHLFKLMQNKSWVDYFPLTSSYYAMRNELDLPDDYMVIHLRRGDYLQVAARIVGVDEVCNLLNRLKNLIPLTVLIVSDSKLSKSDFDSISKVLQSQNIEVIVGGDAHAIHGIMRQSKILITSNSAYSLSAALTMTNHGFSIVPKDFHGERNKSINNSYHALASWNVI